MPKNQVGVKKNYQKQYEQLQREMHGVKAWVKKEYYREFYKRIAKTADQRLVELERLVREKILRLQLLFIMKEEFLLKLLNYILQQYQQLVC